jgi:hypothetical protein
MSVFGGEADMAGASFDAFGNCVGQGPENVAARRDAVLNEANAPSAGFTKVKDGPAKILPSSGVRSCNVSVERMMN